MNYTLQKLKIILHALLSLAVISVPMGYVWVGALLLSTDIFPSCDVVVEASSTGGFASGSFLVVLAGSLLLIGKGIIKEQNVWKPVGGR